MPSTMTPAKARKDSLRSLLAIERASSVRLAATARDVSDRAAREIASGRDPHAALIDASHLLETLVGRDLLLIRSAARRESSRTFVAEALVCGLPGLRLPQRNDAALDRSRATSAAKAFAGAWLARGIVLLGETDPGSVGAPSAALSASQARLETTARTEPAQAFGDERAGLSDDYAEESRRRGLIVPLKVWDATMDRTCPACAKLNGTVRPFGVPFPDGAIPGAMHPRCACVEGVLPLPIPGESETTVEEAA